MKEITFIPVRNSGIWKQQDHRWADDKGSLSEHRTPCQQTLPALTAQRGQHPFTLPSISRLRRPMSRSKEEIQRVGRQMCRVHLVVSKCLREDVSRKESLRQNPGNSNLKSTYRGGGTH